jgi:hypothetical protein
MASAVLTCLRAEGYLRREEQRVAVSPVRDYAITRPNIFGRFVGSLDVSFWYATYCKLCP